MIKKSLLRDISEAEYLAELKAGVPEIVAAYTSHVGRQKTCPHVFLNEANMSVPATHQVGDQKVLSVTIGNQEIRLPYVNKKCEICGAIVKDFDLKASDIAGIMTLATAISAAEYQTRVIINPDEMNLLAQYPSHGINRAMCLDYHSNVADFWTLVSEEGIESLKSVDTEINIDKKPMEVIEKPQSIMNTTCETFNVPRRGAAPKL